MDRFPRGGLIDCGVADGSNAMGKFRKIRLPRWIVEVIEQQALDESPLECCGLIAGQIEPATFESPCVVVAETIYPVDNEARSPSEYFAATGLFAPFQEMRRTGQSLLAIYHSHPKDPPIPSKTDLARNFYPDVLHGIVSLQGDLPELRFFHLDEHDFHACPHTLTTTNPSHANWLNLAVQLSRRCPKTPTSFAVGSAIVSPKGKLQAMGYSLELGPGYHAEQVAIEKAVQSGLDVRGSTIYSTLEPCSIRASGKRPCVDRIVEAGITRVVFAMKEPPVFVQCEGHRRLEEHGLVVEIVPSFAPRVAEVNRHLLENPP